MNKKKKVLYISPDGILEPLGDSQVLKYLEKLSAEFSISLISFEKIDDLQNIKKLNEIEDRCRKHKICWKNRPYSQGKFLLSHIFNIFNFFVYPIFLMLNERFYIVHIRSYMPGICIPFLSLIFNFKLVFDIRGFWADEKHDRLGWKKQSPKYLFFKRLEKYLFQRSDAVVTLTHASKKYIINKFLKPSNKIHVIRTCVDFNEFNVSEDINKKNNLVIGYLGSIDTAYDFDKFLYFVKNIYNYDKKIELHLLTKATKEKIMNLLIEHRLQSLKFKNYFLNRNELRNAINKFDLLAFCLKENFSILASMPTKIGESLACGVPIICNAFNEDIKEMLTDESIGEIYNFVDPFSENRYRRLLSKIKSKKIVKICNTFAKKEFSLDSGVNAYKKIYEEI